MAQIGEIYLENNVFKVRLKEAKQTLSLTGIDTRKNDFAGLFIDEYELNRNRDALIWVEIEGDKYNIKSTYSKSPVIEPSNPDSQKQIQPQSARRDENRQAATAPYNFVSLNQTVVPTNAKDNDFSIYKDLSGYIEVTVTAKTPLFIRGIGAEFFKIGDAVAIPGSSFRGLIRTMVEMMSYGKFTNFEDRELYHRLTVIDDTKAEKSGIKKKIGFLHFNNTEKTFEIFEAKELPAQYSRSSNYSQDEFTYKFETDNSKLYININTGSFGVQNHLIQNFRVLYEQKEGSSGIPINDSIIKSYKDDDTRNTKKDMGNVVELAKKPDRFSRSLPQDIDYIGVPVWYEVDESESIPTIISFGHCKNYRVPYDYSIGKEAHIPHILQISEITDFAESIFGKVKGLSVGKVYFEDLKISNETVKLEENILNTLATPKPTAYQMYLEQKGKQLKTWSNEAKIRGYKQYWHRDTDNSSKQNWRNITFRKLDFDKFKLKALEKDQIVTDRIYKIDRRGQRQMDHHNHPIVETYITKNYAEWPQSIQRKVRDVIMSNETIQFTVVQTIPISTTFNGRIRFDNLTEVELGALLRALNLPEGCCHKIGMGKPLGLGSIKVKADLTLVDREKKYSQLFEGDNWFESKISSQKDYKIDFENYIIDQLRDKPDKENVTSFWELSRMKQLKKMLDFDPVIQAERGWLDKTKYMALAEFKNRPVLPKPDEVP
ncbi:MAG: RAMP superfamily CRISPR-associated protein [Spirosomataceae bacterium]